MAKFTAYVRTDAVGSRVEVPFEVPDNELEGLSMTEREGWVNGYARDAVMDHYEWGWTGDKS